MIDKIAAEITALGGKIETVQKMDKRSFARNASKKHTSGYYMNLIFAGQPGMITQLRARFALNEDVFRVMFSVAPPLKEPAAAA
jgi:ribosomal protein S6